jgi:hypothetical protein
MATVRREVPIGGDEANCISPLVRGLLLGANPADVNPSAGLECGIAGVYD